jgi:hypothetical protein
MALFKFSSLFFSFSALDIKQNWELEYVLAFGDRDWISKPIMRQDQ